MVANLGIYFSINLLSVIATTYILTWYILTPSPNQCQMTFMMEPPKFLPIKVDEESQLSTRDEVPTYPTAAIDTGDNQETTAEYKLYMYSEFGFPMASNVRHDLKDSMPVLFVPGNAGSYQQVRSLASTCIRKQLQSLDAFKFIFYTIDFGGQFSGISGDLIERQTLFVQKSLRQITRMHPSDTEGTILVGHSVGGFISKFLFTRANFKPNSVPLMISLASPLTRPYLMFDDKMGEIYRKTEQYWNKHATEHRDTIAISINGGGTDRLVPMHLSLDPTFDLSLTTECMKDVFLPTDHVSVTWCRELMHKLAKLLSSLMDKKQTRLIPDKSSKLTIIENELLLKMRPQSSFVQYKGDWNLKGSNEILQLADFHHLHRNQLGDSIYIFARPSDQDLVIIIDHIEPIKASAIFGCSGISYDAMRGKQVTCHARHDLVPIASPLPTSRYEPRRTVLKLSDDLSSNFINHVGFDFTNLMQRGGPPEMISIQKMSRQATSQLRIPSLLESLIRKVLFMPIRLQILPNLNSTIELVEIEFVGLESTNHPALSVALVTGNCASKGRPHSSTILYYRKGYLSASAHLPPIETKALKGTRVKLSLRESILWRPGADHDYDEKSYLDIYLDGTCENLLELELDPLNLAAHLLQTELGIILSNITFFLTTSVVILATKLASSSEATKVHELVRIVVVLIGSSIVIVVSRLLGGSKRVSMAGTDLLDSLTSVLLTLIFSHGLLSFSIYFTRRLIDLVTIINNTHLVLKHKVTSARESEHSGNAEAKENGHGSNGTARETKNQTKTDFDWPLIGLAIASGAFLSYSPITMLAIFLLIKTSIGLSLASSSAGEETNKHCCGHRDTKKQISIDHKDALVVNLIIMSSLVLIVNIPDLLLKLTSRAVNLSIYSFSPAATDSFHHRNLGADYAAISVALILKKLICDRLESGGSSGAKLRWMRDGIVLRNLFRLTTSKFTSALTLVPIILIGTNIRLLTTVDLLLSMWLLNHLNFRLAK